MKWEPHAASLAHEVTHRASRWREPIATVPRHLFVPRWWRRARTGWELHVGADNEQHWLDVAYRDTSLITRAGPLHADHASPADRPIGRPTSSATLPSLVVRMLQHARLDDGDSLLHIGTGSGYTDALAARRLGSGQVTSVDVDPYLVESAGVRLADIGLRPTLVATDGTGPLPLPPGSTDRIVSTVAVRPIPGSWLTALCLGGRLVTTLAGTSLLITAEKDEDGGAFGRVEWDRAGFMHTRSGNNYPAGDDELLATARHHDGEDLSTGPFPVVDVASAWDLASMLDLIAPGIEHDYREDDEQRTALMTHPDGSWARATGRGTDRPTVHQGGPRRLWDLLDQVRNDWLASGELPVRGAHVFIKPDGTTLLARGDWHTKISP
ncbi:methyltransferase domain-containing protein [Streptomyces sp. NPDC056411]|uniref:methyltransferase domain-containing protein n=1 Tax=Streptomyces sp. NPDC056411 TaxID=3345813 RepID=UPI0035E32E9A